MSIDEKLEEILAIIKRIDARQQTIKAEIEAEPVVVSVPVLSSFTYGEQLYPPKDNG